MQYELWEGKHRQRKLLCLFDGASSSLVLVRFSGRIARTDQAEALLTEWFDSEGVQIVQMIETLLFEDKVCVCFCASSPPSPRFV